MNETDANRIAMFGAQMYLQYGHELLCITRKSCAKHDLPNAGPFAGTLNEVQDASFRLGLLAGLRAQQDPVVLRFLEGEAVKIAPVWAMPGCLEVQATRMHDMDMTGFPPPAMANRDLPPDRCGGDGTYLFDMSPVEVTTLKEESNGK